MRKWLLLALFLYDIIFSFAVLRSGMYERDYDEFEANKRHSMVDDRRNWRKKALLKDSDHKDWVDRRLRREEFENQRYGMDEMDRKSMSRLDRSRSMDLSESTGYKNHRRQYDDLDTRRHTKSSEYEKDNEYNLKRKSDSDKKNMHQLNCDRQHERYENCFAGCAAVTCDNPRERLRPCYPFCEQGCICVHPYVRDDRTHKCVLPEDCTKGLKGIPDLGGES